MDTENASESSNVFGISMRAGHEDDSFKPADSVWIPVNWYSDCRAVALAGKIAPEPIQSETNLFDPKRSMRLH